MKALTRDIGVIIAGLSLFGSSCLRAETEPADDTTAGATNLAINTTAMGNISNSDDDYYKITNLDEFDAIKIDFSFQGSGPDYHGLVILDQNLTQISNQSTSGSAHSATYTITGASKGAVFYIMIDGRSADGNHSYELTTAGTGGPTGPEIEVARKNNPTILVDGTAKLDFGNIRLGKSKITTFTIKNTGNSELNGLKVSKGGIRPQMKDFKLTQPTATSLAPGKSATFTVYFKPTGKGVRKADLVILSNDADEGLFDIKLRGVGFK
jgi:hypothetical protein